MNSGAFFEHISRTVEEGSRVLDLGCGDGDLLSLLIARKKVSALGVEICEDCIHQCIAKGMSVIHGNVDEGLNDFGNQSFDYVIMSQTLQVLRNPRAALLDAVRVGKRVVITIPNFGLWNVRWQLLLRGRMPVTSGLPYQWYDTPNIHLVTLKDFEDFCCREDFRIITRHYHGRLGPLVSMLPNLFADSAIYVLSARTPPPPED